MVDLDAQERRVLNYLAEEGDDYSGFYAFGFDPIIRETGYDKKTVRRVCRSLAAKGLAEYQRGLWTEDGEPAGSGYSCTKDGLHWYWNAPVPA